MTTVTSGCFKWFLSSKQNTEAAFNDEQIQLDEFKRKKNNGRYQLNSPSNQPNKSSDVKLSMCIDPKGLY